MIRISKAETYGWEAAIRGMRNPMNSWDKSDSYPAVDCGKCGIIDREGICHPKEHDCSEFACYAVGENDLSLMKRLAAAGNDHGKFLRMINVTVDVEAPLYWWKEFDTYKVGTVANSCSTMHKIQAKEFTLEDFSTDHLSQTNLIIMKMVVDALNNARLDFLSQKDKYFKETEKTGSNSNMVQRIYSPKFPKPTGGRIFVRPDYPEIPDGGRNISLTSLAGALHNTGYTPMQIYQELQRVNKEVCKPPLPDRELQIIAESISRYRR